MDLGLIGDLGQAFGRAAGSAMGRLSPPGLGSALAGGAHTLLDGYRRWSNTPDAFGRTGRDKIYLTGAALKDLDPRSEGNHLDQAWRNLPFGQPGAPVAPEVMKPGLPPYARPYGAEDARNPFAPGGLYGRYGLPGGYP
jgi:hypothetical protein